MTALGLVTKMKNIFRTHGNANTKVRIRGPHDQVLFIMDVEYDKAQDVYVLIATEAFDG